MACIHSAPLRVLASACVLVLACNPDSDPGVSESASSSSSTTTGDVPTTGGSTAEPPDSSTGSSDTTAETTDGTSGSTTVEPDSSTGDTTTGEPVCMGDAAFTASYDAWKAAVAANGTTYYYSVLRSEGGFQQPDYCFYRTLIAVIDGEVYERRYEVAEVLGEATCDAEWIEKGVEIGKHSQADQPLAAPPVTVDALYGACCETLAMQPADEYMFTFETDKDGLMKTCYYVLNGCADDCSGGPLGASLEFEVIAFGEPPPP